MAKIKEKKELETALTIQEQLRGKRQLSYAELCKIFGMKKTSGEAREKQFEEMRRYAVIKPTSECPDKCSGAKIGYYIERVYPTPKPDYTLSTARMYLAKTLKPQLCRAMLDPPSLQFNEKGVQVWSMNQLISATRILARMPERKEQFGSYKLLEPSAEDGKLTDEEEKTENGLSLLMNDFMFSSIKKQIKTCLKSMERDDKVISCSEVRFTIPVEDSEIYHELTSTENAAESLSTDTPEAVTTGPTPEQMVTAKKFAEMYYGSDAMDGLSNEEIMDLFTDDTEPETVASGISQEGAHRSTDDELKWETKTKAEAFVYFGIDNECDIYKREWSFEKRKRFYDYFHRRMIKEHQIIIVRRFVIRILDKEKLRANLPKDANAAELQKAFFRKRKKTQEDYVAKQPLPLDDSEMNRICYSNELISLFYVYILGKPIPKNLKEANRVKLLSESAVLSS